MEQYKLLNAELMDQVQKQRIIIGEMLKSEVLLKRQLLEERELRLADAQYAENKLKCGIRTLLQSLDINLDSDPGSMRSSLAAEDTNRQSTGQICSELRRSSALRQRTLIPSPSRRSRSQNTCSVVSCNNSQEMDEETEQSSKKNSPFNDKVQAARRTPEPRHLSELQANMSSPDTPEAVAAAQASPNPMLTPPAALMYSIIEESDNEDNTLSSSIAVIETEGSCSMDISPLPLRDKTNQRGSLLSSPRNTKNIKRVSQIETENIIQEHVRCVPPQTSKITTTRGKAPRPVKDETDNDIQESSIQPVRRAALQSSSMQLKVPCTSVDMGQALTPRRSQLNFTCFNGIADRPGDSSTPQRCEEIVDTKRKAVSTRSKPKAKPKPKPSKSTSGQSLPADSATEQSSGDGSVFTRHSRSCRPKSLKEPSCKEKMRNESSSK